MLRLPPEANPYTSKPWAGNSDHEAFNQGAEAQLNHAMEKVREFEKAWRDCGLKVITRAAFVRRFGVAWQPRYHKCFDSWLSHEGVK